MTIAVTFQNVGVLVSKNLFGTDNNINNPVTFSPYQPAPTFDIYDKLGTYLDSYTQKLLTKIKECRDEEEKTEQLPHKKIKYILN
jgi:hypothetical protein